MFKDNGYVTVRAGKIYHGGIDDAKSWGETSDKGGTTDDGSGTPVGKTMVVPHAQIPMPDGVLPPLPADNARAAYSDRIVVLDGNGEGHGDYLTADRTIENLRKYQDQPFFIACGFVKPHSPPTAPQRFFDLYDADKIKLTPDFAAWPTVPPGFPSAAIRQRNADLFIGRGAGEAEAKQVIRAYLASISWTDWNIGRVLGELDKLGLRENTIVVFVADHGYQLGEKGKWSKAGSLFEMGTRVPLIISAPGMNGNGESCTRIVESLAIYPTLVELCGLPRQNEIEGKSLAPLLNNPSAEWTSNAATINRNAPLWKVPAEEFSQVIDVNVKGVVNVIRHFLPAMIERGRGVVVNFSSWWGRERGGGGRPVLRHEVGDRGADPGDGGGTAPRHGCRARDPRHHRHGDAAELLRSRRRELSRPGGVGGESGAVPPRSRTEGQRQADGSAGVRRGGAAGR